MVPLAINEFRTKERREISRLMIEFKFEISCNNKVETIFGCEFSFDTTFA